MGSIPGSGRFPGGGNGNLFQYPCLGNPLDRGVWQYMETRTSDTTEHADARSLRKDNRGSITLKGVIGWFLFVCLNGLFGAFYMLLLALDGVCVELFLMYFEEELDFVHIHTPVHFSGVTLFRNLSFGAFKLNLLKEAFIGYGTGLVPLLYILSAPLLPLSELIHYCFSGSVLSRPAVLQGMFGNIWR